MALVDPNIALSYRGIQLQDPLDQYSKASAAQFNALKMDEIMRERDALSQIQSSITAKGGPPDLRVAAEAMFKTGRPEFVKTAISIFEKLDNQKRYEDYLRQTEGAPSPAPAPTPTAAPVNALAPSAAAAPMPAPVNALAAPVATSAPAPAATLTVSPTVRELQNRFRQVVNIDSPAARAEAQLIKTQIENALRIESAERMLTPGQEEQKIRIAQASRPDRLLTPEEEAQKIRVATASRPDRLLTPEEEAQKVRIAAMTRPVQNINLPPQEKAEQSDRGKLLVKQYEAISEAARIGARSLPALQSNIAILDKGFDTGFGTETKAAGAKVLAALGVKDAEKYATDAQTFLGNASAAVLQRQLEQKGPQTEADAQRITQTGAQLGNTKDANKFLINVAKAQINRDIEQRNFYDKWWKANKTYDGAEDAWFAGEGGKSLFERPELKNVRAAPSLVNQIPTGRAPTQPAVRPSTAPAAKPAATPIPQAAIDALKAKKGTPEQFDEIFGAGAAKRVLGGK
jgi:hypothetical protein